MKFYTTPLKITLGVDALKQAIKAESQSIIDGIDRMVAKQSAGGMTDEAIVQMLLADFDNPDSVLFGSLKNRLSKEVGSFMGGLASDEVKSVTEEGEGVDPNADMQWVATLVNTCPDCLELHGDTKSMEEWEAEGVPNVRPTICTFRGYCHCELIPVDSMSAADRQSVTEPIQLQKDRIQQYADQRKNEGVTLSEDYINMLEGQANNPESVVNAPDTRKAS